MMTSHTRILPLPIDLSDTWLDEKLYIDALTDQYQQTYQYLRRTVIPAGFTVHPQAIVKLYHMAREGVELPQYLVTGLVDFVYTQIETGQVVPTQGVGFAILSQGFLSINCWGRGNVLFTTTYTVEDSFPNLSRKPLDKTGVACTWEIRIMAYEYDLWQQYLETAMTLADKRAYLQNFLSGKLYRETKRCEFAHRMPPRGTLYTPRGSTNE